MFNLLACIVDASGRKYRERGAHRTGQLPELRDDRVAEQLNGLDVQSVNTAAELPVPVRG